MSTYLLIKDNINKVIMYFFLCLTTLFNSCSKECKSNVLAMVNVNIIPMDSERILESQTLIVEKTKIVKIGPSSIVEIPKNAQLIDGKNKYLIPGLMDMHVHLEESDLDLFLANGITTVRNLNGNEKHLELRKKVTQGKILGPKIYTSGPLISGPKTKWKIKSVPKSIEDVKKIVKVQSELGYDFIKVYDGLTNEIYLALMEEANKRNITVVGHIPQEVGLSGILNAGQASIEHIEKIVKDNFETEYDFQKAKKISEEIKFSRAFVCPTIALQENYYLNSQGEYLKNFDNPEMFYVDFEIMKWWKSQTEPQNNSASLNKKYKDFYNFQLKLTKLLFDMKIPLLAGTDTPNLGMVPGFSIHEELRSLVKAGLRPYHALETATSNAAIFLGKEREIGMIKEDMLADLVLLDKNPLINILNTKSIEGIVIQGKWYSKSNLLSIKK